MNININSSMEYWYEGASSLSIKSKITYLIGLQGYWYNGTPQGFVNYISPNIVPRTYSILIGF